MAGDGFPTTQWSLVWRAGEGDKTGPHDALSKLCQAYWQSVYVRIRRMGKDVDAAQDLTQGFFADFLEKRWFEAADPNRGRFRCFLQSLLKQYLSHEWRRNHALKRGGGLSEIELDFEDAESRYHAVLGHEETPERCFERLWGRTLLNRALESHRLEVKGTAGEERFKRLEPYLTGELQGQYAQLAVELNMTEGAVRTAISRLRQRFGEVLRAEVTETVDDPALVDDELRHLFAVLVS